MRSQTAQKAPASVPSDRSMLWFVKRSPDHSQALERVREWTRSRFALPEEAAILVTELACGLPGCPPIETVVAFWTDADTRHQFKLFKRVEEVLEDDLPPSWMKNALIADETAAYCGC